jgi:tRNA-specific 2-thiouridylase
MAKQKVLVAMSGGVDSTVAAILLREQGFEVIGVTMKTWEFESSGVPKAGSGCCSLDAIHDARAIAVQFGFPHYVLDLRKEFEEKIVSNFVSEYLAGRTPNPCVMCNKWVKWADLLKTADDLGCEFIATGHYAQLAVQNGRRFLKRGKDRDKDQTYVLWGLSQENLARTLLPLGELAKDAVRTIARSHGLEHIASKSESYEICFVPDDDYRSFLKFKVPDLEKRVDGGLFMTRAGQVLGTHKGYPFYTIGQRKGLVVAVGHPLYVNGIDPEKNIVYLGTREELERSELTASSLNLMKYENLDGMPGVTVRIRYHDAGSSASVKQTGDTATIIFDAPVQAITPGQSAVFYEADDLLGGGIIDV